MLGHQRLDRGDRVFRRNAGHQPGVDPILDPAQAQLDQSLHLDAERRHVVTQVLEGAAPPQLEGLVDPMCRRGGIGRQETSCVRECVGEPIGIELAGFEQEGVAVASANQPVLAQGATEVRDVRVQRPHGPIGCGLAPELLDQAVRCDHLTR